MGKTYSLLFVLALLAGLLAGLKALKLRQQVAERTNPSRTEFIPTPVPTTTPTISDQSQSIDDKQFVTIALKNRTLSVEVADTPLEIQAGLSNRTEIGSDGMLFIIDPPQAVSFWMKNMLLSLDMIWIADNKILGITSNVPHPKPQTKDSQLPTYHSPGSVDYVLEIPSGVAAEYGLHIGDQVTIQ